MLMFEHLFRRWILVLISLLGYALALLIFLSPPPL